MPDSKRPQPISPKALALRARSLAGRAARAARALATDERSARARELLRVPAGLYMRAAERAGQAVLAVWLAVWPWLLALLRLVRRTLRWAERELTPRRVTLATAAAVAALLAVSQFADYTATRIGVEAYQGIEDIAPAPEMRTASAGSAHAWLGLPLAAMALLGTAACARGRRVGAAALAAAGLAVLAISLLVDLPKGLDEGEAALAYEDVNATLEAGFWVQLVCGALLVALAPLAAARTRAPEPRERRKAWAVRKRSASRGRSGGGAPEGLSLLPRGRRRASKDADEGGEAPPGEPLPEG